MKLCGAQMTCGAGVRIAHTSHSVARGRLSVLALNVHDAGSSQAVSRRQHLQQAVVLAATLATVPGQAWAESQSLSYFADSFTTTPMGLRYLDIKVGEGAVPEPGDTCVVNWAGYTKGYQGKRFGNSSLEDRDPYEFVLGAKQAIPAFEEAVSGMRAGGLRRIEIPGSIPGLGYPLDRSQRFSNERSIFSDKIYKYRLGPQPQDFFGQRALDFVLDNSTLQDFNRDLLFDIKLLAVRKARR